MGQKYKQPEMFEGLTTILLNWLRPPVYFESQTPTDPHSRARNAWITSCLVHEVLCDQDFERRISMVSLPGGYHYRGTE